MSATSIFRITESIYLFTADIIQPVIIPWTVVGICSALAIPGTDQISTPHRGHLAARIPQAFLWMWLNFLTFAIGNQRLPDAIREDKINKPWRPLPSGRLTVDQAQILLLILIPVQLAIGAWLGVSHLTSLALVLSYLYNDLGGADLHWISRNALNAFAIGVACTGSALIVGHDQYQSGILPPSSKGRMWAFLQVALILTTIQVQDLRDKEGDKVRGRSTMPLVLGDNFTRWSVAVAVILWSWCCPVFWNVDRLVTALVLFLGICLVLRVLLWRDVVSDRTSWRFWGLWSLFIFMLPLHSYFINTST